MRVRFCNYVIGFNNIEFHQERDFKTPNNEVRFYKNMADNSNNLSTASESNFEFQNKFNQQNKSINSNQSILETKQESQEFSNDYWDEVFQSNEKWNSIYNSKNQSKNDSKNTNYFPKKNGFSFCQKDDFEIQNNSKTINDSKFFRKPFVNPIKKSELLIPKNLKEETKNVPTKSFRTNFEVQNISTKQILNSWKTQNNSAFQSFQNSNYEQPDTIITPHFGLNSSKNKEIEKPFFEARSDPLPFKIESSKNKNMTEKTETHAGTCPVCMDDFPRTTSVISNCRHRFCSDCINEWAQHSSTCPLCKGEFNQLEEFTGVNLVRRKRVKKRKLVYEYVETEEDRIIHNADNFCYVCEKTSNENFLMICDFCLKKCCHTFCLDPPLSFVPQDDWFCDFCFRLNGKKSNNPIANIFKSFKETQTEKINKEKRNSGKSNQKRGTSNLKGKNDKNSKTQTSVC